MFDKLFSKDGSNNISHQHVLLKHDPVYDTEVVGACFSTPSNIGGPSDYSNTEVI